MGAMVHRDPQGDPPTGDRRAGRTGRPGRTRRTPPRARPLRASANRRPCNAGASCSTCPRAYGACLSRVPGKRARTVLRGPWRGNAPGLPDNHADDHIDVLTRAIAQIPTAHRKRLLVRADGAGATHQLLDWLTAQGQVRGRHTEYSVGFPTKNAAVTSAIARLPAQAWTPAVTSHGEPREHA